MTLRQRRARARQRGASMVEFVLVAMPLLLAGLVVVEIGYALMARQALRLALHEAARAGAVQHGEPRVIASALEAALTPLYVPAGSSSAGTDSSPRARMQASHARVQHHAGLALWRLEILAPSASAYQDFGRPNPRYDGRLAIANDYLAEQHERALQNGSGGIGTQSGLTIFEANVLHLRLTYLRTPVAPLTAALLQTASPLASAPARPALAAGLLPLTLEARMTMQSDPLAWPTRVVVSAAASE